MRPKEMCPKDQTSILRSVVGSGLALASSLIIAVPGLAEQICKVTDPTGTPLNVRATPNGKIVNALRNGREVEILEIDYDEQGRPWAKIAGYYQGQYRVWGWVIREFISCYRP